jgi:hypothetical protein
MPSSVLHWLLNFLINSAGLTFNLFLLYLIQTRSGQLSMMRPLLNCICLLGLGLSFVNLISGPVGIIQAYHNPFKFLTATRGHFIYSWNGLFETDSEHLIPVFISLSAWLTVGSIGCLPVQFLYRLDVIKQ